MHLNVFLQFEKLRICNIISYIILSETVSKYNFYSYIELFDIHYAANKLTNLLDYNTKAQHFQHLM